MSEVIRSGISAFSSTVLLSRNPALLRRSSDTESLLCAKLDDSRTFAIGPTNASKTAATTDGSISH
jgi:hypothetical protein